ncbi:MAG: hypothetical protein ACFFD2_15040 [Promethearchaeota archaeon]
MGSTTNNKKEESESTLMRVLTGILEDSVQSLQRIEKAVNGSTVIANQLIEKIDLIDKKIESGFIAVVKKALPSLEHKFTEKIDKVSAFGEVTTLLPDIITKLQQSMQILTIQNLLNELDKLGGVKKKKLSKKETEKEDPSKKGALSKETIPQSPQEEVSQIQKSDKEKEKGDDHLLRPSSFFGS